MTTQKQIRASFWETFPQHEETARKNGVFGKGQNSQNCDTRCAWVDYVDSLAKDGQISDGLADRVTL